MEYINLKGYKHMSKEHEKLVAAFEDYFSNLLEDDIERFRQKDKIYDERITKCEKDECTHSILENYEPVLPDPLNNPLA